MNRKPLILFIILLAVALLLPMVAGRITSSKPAPVPGAANSPADSEQEPDPVAAETPVEETVYEEPPAAAPFQFTAQTLVNTAWQVQTDQGPVKVELLPGGKALATHSMVGSLEGRWRVQGNGLTITASFMNQTKTISCFIQGDQLIYEGYQIQRLR